MEQTKVVSLIESMVNVSSGFIISLIFWTIVIVPVFKLDVSMHDNLLITAMFTVLSILRGYFWRRFFNAGLHKTAVKWAKQYYAMFT